MKRKAFRWLVYVLKKAGGSDGILLRLEALVVVVVAAGLLLGIVN
jgi:hypothetical protein